MRSIRAAMSDSLEATRPAWSGGPNWFMAIRRNRSWFGASCMMNGKAGGSGAGSARLRGSELTRGSWSSAETSRYLETT